MINESEYLKMIVKFRSCRLQKGTTSYIIPIPSVWVASVGIEKGAVLNVEMLEDNSLRIIP